LVNANRNPGKTKAQIEAELLSKYGATKMIWFPGLVGRDITDDHIDGTARFVRPGVVINQLPPPSHADIWAQDERQIDKILRSSTDAKGRQLQLYTVYGPDSLPRVPQNEQSTFFDGYLNFCIAGDAVITAQFGDTAKDAAAKATIEAAFPGKTCVQLNLDHLHGDGGGGAHCVTMQEPLA
jgi:agmatine deiminase